MEKLSFIESIGKILPYVDPDSPRFVDWINVQRMAVGLSTRAQYHKFHNDKAKIMLPDMIEVVKATLEAKSVIDSVDIVHEYESDGLYRMFVIKPTDKGDVIRLNVVIGRNRSECSIAAVGERDVVEWIISDIKECFKEPEVISIRTLMGFSDSGPIVREDNLKNDDKQLFLARDDFYPFLGTTVEELAKAYLASRANILILIGPPGTGKSTLLRSLMFYMKRETNSAINNEVLMNDPRTMQWMQKHGDGDLIIMEDADNLCRKRSDGNHQMSSLLNHADGIVQNDCKIIISTNLPSLRDVDDAIIRPGRAFKVIVFEELNVEQANVARAAIGLPELDNPSKRNFTLSEALHYEQGFAVKQRTGF